MFLVSLEVGGAFKNNALPYMRVGPYFSITVMLALMFIIPHDPSTRIRPDQVGADGYAMTSMFRRNAFQPQQHAADAPGRRRSVPMRVLFRAARKAAWKSGVSWEGAAFSPPASPELPMPASNYSFTTVEELRSFYGPRQNWWGDFDARQTRELYHSLLPTQLLEDESLSLGMEDRARMAVAARRAARLYARERGVIPVTIACQLLDGLRVLCDKGTWQPDGLSEEQIFAKYAEQFGVSPDACHDEVYYTILRKSCTSNMHIDTMVGMAEHAAPAL